MAAVAAAIVAFVVVAPGSGSDPVDVAAVVDADDRVTVPLDGELSGMELVHSPALGASALVGSAIPTPDDDDVYELWMISDAAPEPVDTFRPDEDGDVELLIEDSDVARRRRLRRHDRAARRQRATHHPGHRRQRLISARLTWRRDGR